jgi:DNA-directed RNA polymerase specialized sigma subunit
MTAYRNERVLGYELPSLLCGLSDREQVCLRLRYAQRLQNPAISEALGLSLADVARTIATAMRKLAGSIESGSWEPERDLNVDNA